eukprot:1150672-Pelagomonas_calceolata.AAC.2
MTSHNASPAPLGTQRSTFALLGAHQEYHLRNITKSSTCSSGYTSGMEASMFTANSEVADSSVCRSIARVLSSSLVRKDWWAERRDAWKATYGRSVCRLLPVCVVWKEPCTGAASAGSLAE